MKKLQDMGIKVVLATGIGEQEAKQIALECGILQKEHEAICGAVIEGSNLRKIYNGQDTDFQF